MSSNSGANTRVSIPTTLRKTIQDIKEISGNHSDEDVYAMLKECSMDPNETVQRLLFLDTFHEVKRKRDKRKEDVNGRMFESSRRKPGNQGRGAWSGRGSFSSQYASHDAGGERVAAVRKENGFENKRERGLQSPALPVLKKVETEPFPSVSKTSVAPVNDPTCLPSDGLSNGHVLQNSEIVNTSLPNNVKDADAGVIKPEATLPQTKANTKHAASADTNLVPMQSRDPQIPNAVVAGSHVIAANARDSVIAEGNLSNSQEFADETTKTNGHGSGKVEKSEPFSSRSEKSEHKRTSQPKMNGESLDTEKLSLPPVPDTIHAAGPTKAIEEVTTKLDKFNFAEVQHVILPNHIQVPDAVKNVLSFGSLGARFTVGVTDINSSISNRNSNEASELFEDESAEEPESCDEGTPTPQEENYPHPPQDVPETISSPENNFSAPKDDQVKQETVPAVGPPYPLLQPTPTYGFGFMPPMLGSPLVPIEGLDHQARLLNSVIGNSLALSTSAPTPPPAQSPPGAVSVAASTQSLPVIRQPYPPNYIPYAHYLPQFFMPPTLQFLAPGGFPPQFPTANMYLPAAAAAAAAASGMKVSPPYKPGTNLMSQAPVGLPSGAFGAYGSPQVGYNPSAVVTSGTSNPNEDFIPSVLKDNNVYLAQQSEGTTVWPTSLPVNPFFSLPQHSPHVAMSPQSIPGAFAALYHHPLHTVASAAAAQPLVHQPESMVGPPEGVGPLPPPNSFHQPPQHQQMNWNGGF